MGAAAALAGLATATWFQSGHWRDQVTLFSHAIAATGPNGRAHHLLSQGYIAEGRWPEALVHALEAARLDPANPRTHKNLGFVLYRTGRIDEAIASLERAVALDPGYAEAHGNLAIAYGRKGRTEDAVREMRIEMQLRARSPPADSYFPPPRSRSMAALGFLTPFLMSHHPTLAPPAASTPR